MKEKMKQWKFVDAFKIRMHLNSHFYVQDALLTSMDTKLSSLHTIILQRAQSSSRAQLQIPVL